LGSRITEGKKKKWVKRKKKDGKEETGKSLNVDGVFLSAEDPVLGQKG